MDVLLATGEQTTIALTAMAINGLGKKAVSLTGAQAGIITDGVHTKAKIANITPKQVHEYLKDDYIVIVAGFQGETTDGRITTLGRGGSDLTAIAIAAAIKAECLPDSHRRGRRLYLRPAHRADGAGRSTRSATTKCSRWPRAGSKVMQSRSVEFAKKFGVVFEVRSSFNNNPGTIVKEETMSMENVVVRGVSVEKNQAKVTIRQVPDRPGIAAKIFSALAGANVIDRHDRAKRQRRATPTTFPSPSTRTNCRKRSRRWPASSRKSARRKSRRTMASPSSASSASACARTAASRPNSSKR